MDSSSFWEKDLGKYFGDIVISMSDVHYAYNYSGEKDLKLLGNVNGERVIEVGCGGGHNSIALAKMGASVCGIDMSSEMIASARLNARNEGVNVDFEHRRAEELEMMSGGFNIALSSYVFDYIKDIGKVISNVAGLLKGGGVFVLSYCHPDQMPEGCGVEDGVFFMDGNWPETDTVVRNYFHSTERVMEHFRNAGMRLENVIDAKTPMLKDITSDMIESWPYRTLVTSDGFDEAVKKPHTIILKAVKD